jgi:hypothetical protein
MRGLHLYLHDRATDSWGSGVALMELWGSILGPVYTILGVFCDCCCSITHLAVCLSPFFPFFLLPLRYLPRFLEKQPIIHPSPCNTLVI